MWKIIETQRRRFKKVIGFIKMIAKPQKSLQWTEAHRTDG